MQVIDNNGVVYSSIREFCRVKEVNRSFVQEKMKANGFYENKSRGIKLFPIQPASIIATTYEDEVIQSVDNVAKFADQQQEVDEEYEAFKAIRTTDFKLIEIERPKSSDGVRYAVALFSDVHIEETVKREAVLDRNEYNIEIAERRVKAYFANLATCLKKDEVEMLIFASLGDTISSFIHPHLEQENGATPLEATYLAQSLIVSGLRHIRREIPSLEIHFIGIAGNHSRTTKKVQNSNGFKLSYEWLMYKNIEDTCKQLELGITFNIPESEVALVVAPDDKRYIFCHGFQVQSKGTGTVAGIYPALNRLAMKWRTTFNQDKIFLGHYHTCVSIPSATVNGSIIGYNAFALSNGMGYEEPAQQYEVYDSEIGQLLSRKIYCK